MFIIKTFSTIVLFVLSIEAIDESSDSDLRQKRRLPENVNQYKWTTTTVRPDDVYIEPLSDIKGSKI